MNSNFLNYWKKNLDLISWKKKPKKILEKKKHYFKWFKDGKINVYQNCVKNNLYRFQKKEALIIYDKNKNKKTYTFEKLDILIENFSYQLFKYKLSSKDIVAIHASASIESAVAMLSCAKLGITFSVIFEDLPISSVIKRINLLNAKILITRSNNNFIKDILKNNKNIKNRKLKIINFCDKAPLNKKIHHIRSSSLLKKKRTFDKIFFKNSNHPLFILFTSGSTGDPKGIIHSGGGYLLYAKYTCKKQFGINSNSVVFTGSDAGWINGHTYALFGPLSFGATSILVEKPIDILDKNFLAEIIKSNNVSILYLPVTLIRLMKCILGTTKFFNNNSIKSLGSMGEPLAKDVALWFSKTFKNNKLSIVNTYFQTETGGIISSPKFNFKKVGISHGTVGKPVNKFIKLQIDKKLSSGEIKITTPWPGAMIGVINGKKIFDKYWDDNGNFKLFDLGKFNKHKLLEVFGRNDDVINIRGHRVGSGELESQILSITNIKEACVVPINDDLEGNRLIVFYSKSKNVNNLKIINNIENSLVRNFGSYLKPKFIVELSNLPKTKSGKILRRVLKLLTNNPNIVNIGDLSTIIDKSIITEARKKIIKKINE